MIRTKSIEDNVRHGRLDANTLDSMFRRRIERGANCSPFVSKAILAAVKEVFPTGTDEADHQLGLGQIQLLVVSAEEPAGKPLEQCQEVTVRLTLDAGQEDYQVRLTHGVESLSFSSFQIHEVRERREATGDRREFPSFRPSAFRRVGITPRADGSTLRNCKGEWDFRILARCFRQDTKWVRTTHEI
jgi:hypothetical protein